MIIFYTRRFSDRIIVFTIAFIIMLLVAALTFWVLYPNLVSAIEKEEARECLQWKKWSKEAKEVFYLTSWQKEQCDTRGIKIDAPIRKGE